MDYSVTAIILAAGKGLRMGGCVPKQYLILHDRPVLAHTLQVFNAVPSIDAIVIVSADEAYIKDNILKFCSISKPVYFIEGGTERQDSVWNALQFIGESEVVIIHDGVRPLIRVEVVEECIAAARLYGAAAAGMPSKDTIKEINSQGFSVRTPDRSKMWLIQTPQAFKMDLIKAAHEKARKEQYLGTDDSSLVERMGHPVKLVMGGYDNIKITTPEDLEIAAQYLKNRRMNP
ncbi:MAG TPA: 2-C-methyl-D-erythritol 4-phosphate cytidylyltransferase [Clostridiales bacterium]|nr:2-C-methyl-D-erythritol 4-phosphate cytidylyltransferase [Clostridiales bacterium]